MQQGDEVAGRYRLDELRGQGPMSEVWRAHDHTLDRTVALKILSPTADLDRFRREAQAIAALAHENIMRVYDYGEDGARPFMALEWLPGGTLEDRFGQEPLPPGETHRIAWAIAAGLAHLHSRGLVHRDLKPANVLFDEEGRPKLGDFGLVRRTAGSGTLTEAGTVLGTAAYISPEQAAGEPAGAASDVYSFGVILFRMLTGVLPFAADDALALVAMHRNAPPPAVETLQPDAPPELAALTAASLRKDPARRPPDGAALLDALGSEPTYVGEGDAEATQILRPPAEGPPRRRGLAAAVAVAIVVLAAAGGVLAWAVTRPPATGLGGTSLAGTHTHDSKTTQARTTAKTGTGRHGPTTTRARTTTAATTATAHTTTSTHTTTAHTTTANTTTTAPTTTAPTTTAATTTTAPTTTAATTTAGTASGTTTSSAANR